MTTPSAENTADRSHAPLPLALVRQELGSLVPDTAADARNQAIRKGVEAAGGYVLFELNIGEGADKRWTAAIAFDNDEGRQLAILSIAGSGDMNLEPADECSLPIAAIASSYAGLAEQWGRAA